MPKQTSTAMLPRRYLSGSDNIRHSNPVSPSRLSPIKAAAAGIVQRNNFFRDDSTIDLDDNSAFQHYSVDASRAIAPFTPRYSCFPEPNVESVQVRAADANRSSIYASPRRQLLYEIVASTSQPQLETFRPSTPRANAQHAITAEPHLPSAAIPAEHRYSGASSFARAFTVEGCRRCGKAFPFADQSVDNLTDITVDYCSCTLMGQLQHSYDSEADVTSASDLFASDSNMPSAPAALTEKQFLRDIPITPSASTRHFVFV